MAGTPALASGSSRFGCWSRGGLRRSCAKVASTLCAPTEYGCLGEPLKEEQSELPVAADMGHKSFPSRSPAWEQRMSTKWKEMLPTDTCVPVCARSTF